MTTVNVGEILYFPLRARAEPLKFLCEYAKLGYSDKVVQFDEWAEIKPTIPGGSLPVLVKPGGEMLPETADIARHIAMLAPKELELMPEDESKAKAAAYIFDVGNEQPVSMLNPLTNWFSAEESASKVGGILPDVMKTLVAVSDDLPEDKPFFGGDKPHYGDFGLFHYIDILRTLDDAEYRKLGDKWAAWYSSMANLPGVKELLLSRPKAGTGEVGRPGSRVHTMPLDDFRAKPGQ
eukprot:CAMPEP_0196723330 /NCGR_PEP_ID=MMETSP1091-20130531/5461_1 /TAXON_ID=302021 /ORGANISM="Rhodomonas sp., Strain CCMP768" /LENGTH=235 /DNA_ID=CAMNT_0042065217 /DNA_START=54 /DNA_END=761 /DNA_ORIENTATION=-